LHYAAPRVRSCAEFASQSEDCEDGDGEGAVFAVTLGDGTRKVVGTEGSSEQDEPGFGAGFDGGMAARRGYREGSPG
jgi:hypothetical protein